MSNCNVRFMDNIKIDGNYTVTNEDVSYPLSNALSDIRSEVFRTSATSTRIIVDLGFPDDVNVMTIFAPLGEVLGISKEATIKFQADNVNDWVSPEIDETISFTSDDKIVHYTSARHRFVSLYIDDPTNPAGYITFADLYIGDYTTTVLRNVAPGITWNQNDKTKVSKSLDGTPYFSDRTKYDSFGALQYVLVDETDRQTIQNLFNRNGVSTWMPISLDPGSYVSSSVEELTRLARFAKPVNAKQVAKNRYTLKFTLEEVV